MVGRTEELAVLADLLGATGTRIVCLHGIAGMGKSALVGGFAESARGLGATVIALDCRAVEPTERGILRATAEAADSAALFEHLRSLAPPVVIVLDHYEVFRLMDTWLRQVLVPGLPPGAGLLLAGRERPVAGWFALDGVRTLPLGPLADADACTMLELRGVPAHEAPRLNRIARGHPLALTLASAGSRSTPSSGSRKQPSRVSSRSSRGCTSRTSTIRWHGARSRRHRSCAA